MLDLQIPNPLERAVHPKNETKDTGQQLSLFLNSRGIASLGKPGASLENRGECPFTERRKVGGVVWDKSSWEENESGLLPVERKSPFFLRVPVSGGVHAPSLRGVPTPQ